MNLFMRRPGYPRKGAIAILPEMPPVETIGIRSGKSCRRSRSIRGRFMSITRCSQDFLPMLAAAMPSKSDVRTGNYMVYINKEFGYRVDGLDYSDNMEYVRANLSYNGIQDAELFKADFFELVPAKKYDLVFSGGFAEHFDDHELVVGNTQNGRSLADSSSSSCPI